MKKVFSLSDLDPRACDIEIKDESGQSITLSLKKFSLMSRLWVEKEFGSLGKWESQLFPQSSNYNEALWLETLLKTFHHLIEDKTEFSTWESLGERLEVTPEVLTGMQKALLWILRGSEPLIEKFDEEVKKSLEAKETETKPKPKKKRKAKTGRK